MMYNVGMKKKLIGIAATVIVATGSAGALYAANTNDKEVSYNTPTKNSTQAHVEPVQQASEPEAVTTTVPEETPAPTPAPVETKESIRATYAWSPDQITCLNSLEGSTNIAAYFDTLAEAKYSYKFIVDHFTSPCAAFGSITNRGGDMNWHAAIIEYEKTHPR